MYEFADSENVIIRRTVRWAKALALVEFAAAIYSGVTTLNANVMDWGRSPASSHPSDSCLGVMEGECGLVGGCAK